MSDSIVCPKASGNTYRVAEHLQKQSHAELLVLERNSLTDLWKYDQIYLCTGIYAGKVHKNLSNWLRMLNPEKLRYDVTFHIFLTWFGRGSSDKSAFNEIATILQEKGLSCDDEYASCYGGMSFIRKGHPDDTDLQKAAAWMLGI